MGKRFAPVAISIALAGVALGDFIQPVWTRPADDTAALADLTTFQHWDIFFSAAGPNAPDMAEVNPNDADPNQVADCYDGAYEWSGSFVTSGGNIYSFAGVIEPRVVLRGYEDVSETSFLVQVESQGGVPDPNQVWVNDVRIQSLPNFSYTELSRVDLGGGASFLIEHAWTFTVPGDVDAFQIDFGWNALSASLGQVAVDTKSIAAGSCAGDVNGDSSVNVDDLLLLLSDFGCVNDCAADADADGDVDVNDLLLVLINFGNAC